PTAGAVVRYDLTGIIGVLVVMWAGCLGCGLAVERLVRARLGNALLLPLGLCVAFVVTFPVYVAGAGAVVAALLLAVVVIGGVLLAQGGLRPRLNPGWPG